MAKQKKVVVAAAIVAAVLVLALAVIAIYKWLAPSSSKSDLNSLFKLEGDQAAILADDELLEQRGRVVEGQMYVPAQVATAYMDSTPMVAITGNVPTSLMGQDSFQEVYITGITMPITKHNFVVDRVEDLADTLREAFRIAQTGRKTCTGGHTQGRYLRSGRISSSRSGPQRVPYRD